MRYFKTNVDYLWFVWDGEWMYFSSDCDIPISQWCTISSDTPENLNLGDGEEFLPDDALYAHETDSEWNRL